MPELKIKLTAGTNVGLVRSNNEDNFVVCPSLTVNDWTIPQAGETVGLGPYGALLVVADGMGGANAGEVASGIAIDTVQQSFGRQRLSDVVKRDADILQFLRNVTLDADKAIVKHSKKHKETRGMGTTLVMAWLLQDKAYICWCGDSRCYVYNQQLGLTRLSKDHSLVQELVDNGELLPENAQEHPMSNVITQCLGNARKELCPDARVYQLSNDDILLLCTDGLCGPCSDEEIMHVIVSSTDVITMKNRLIEEALKAGGYDNVTVALCSIDAPSLSSISNKQELNCTLRSYSEEDAEMPLSDNAEEPPPENNEEEETTEAAPQETASSETASPEADSPEATEEVTPAEEPAITDVAEPSDIDLQGYTWKVIVILLVLFFIAAVFIAVFAPDALRQFLKG